MHSWSNSTVTFVANFKVSVINSLLQDLQHQSLNLRLPPELEECGTFRGDFESDLGWGWGRCSPVQSRTRGKGWPDPVVSSPWCSDWAPSELWPPPRHESPYRGLTALSPLVLRRKRGFNKTFSLCQSLFHFATRCQPQEHFLQKKVETLTSLLAPVSYWRSHMIVFL